MGKYLNTHFTTEEIEMASKHMERCLASLITILKSMKNHYITFRMSNIKIKHTYTHNKKPTKKTKTTDDTKDWEDVEQLELIHCWWECKTVQPTLENIWQFNVKLTIRL